MTTETYGISPFRNDDRAGEEGFALETMINKNSILIEIHTNISIDTTPFGIAAQKWPGLESREDIAIKASAAKHGIRYDTLYAVPMSVSLLGKPRIADRVCFVANPIKPVRPSILPRRLLGQPYSPIRRRGRKQLQSRRRAGLTSRPTQV